MLFVGCRSSSKHLGITESSNTQQSPRCEGRRLQPGGLQLSPGSGGDLETPRLPCHHWSPELGRFGLFWDWVTSGYIFFCNEKATLKEVHLGMLFGCSLCFILVAEGAAAATIIKIMEHLGIHKPDSQLALSGPFIVIVLKWFHRFAWWFVGPFTCFYHSRKGLFQIPRKASGRGDMCWEVCCDIVSLTCCMDLSKPQAFLTGPLGCCEDPILGFKERELQRIQER